MKFILLVCSFAVVLSVDCFAYNVTLQPDAANGIDTHVYNYDSNGNNGGNISIPLSAISNIRRGYIKFDLSSLADAISIEHAYLRLYIYSPNATRALRVSQVTSNWSEYEVTWNTRPSFTTVGAVETMCHKNTNEWLEWDITSFVDSWINGSAENYGIQIDQTASRRAYFYTSDYTDNPSLRPMLVLEGLTDAPEAPAIPEPTSLLLFAMSTIFYLRSKKLR